MIESLRGSIWQSKVRSGLGILFLGTCALWAAVIIIQTAWGVNPIAQAFAKALDREVTEPN
jgi:hypothetical protein